MGESQEKIISNLNSIKEMIYNYKKEGDELLENFSEVKDENEIFLKNYNKIQSDKKNLKQEHI